jgi:regulator of cell morphogenesis and NO signaling
MTAITNLSVGEIVAQNWKTASVFQQYHIDFCCRGNITVQEACNPLGIDPEGVLTALTSILEAEEATESDYNSWPLDLLADYIEKKHHKYVTDRLPELMAYLDKICAVHGKHHPELFEIRELFSQTVDELTIHMKKEELMLFPFIRTMTHSEKENLPLPRPIYGSVQNPIQMMQHEHSDEGDRFARIADLSDHYTVPEDACGTYRVAYAMLQEFEQDLHKHIHLENNILFPRAIQLERSLNQLAS